jgi:hypothetical protein
VALVIALRETLVAIRLVKRAVAEVAEEKVLSLTLRKKKLKKP